MKLTTNFSYPNFKGPMYVRGETVDRADAICRSIETEIRLDEILKSSIEDEEASKPADDKADDTKEDSGLDKLHKSGLYSYNDSMLILKLRQASGTEEYAEPPRQDDSDIKKAFMLEEEKRKIDIRA